jgi:hypothetical protein
MSFYEAVSRVLPKKKCLMILESARDEMLKLSALL